MIRTIRTYQTKFKIEKTKQLLITYLKVNNFKVEVINNSIIAKKGSTLGNMVTFNPLSWKSYQEFNVDTYEVRLHSEVDDSFQMVTFSEKKIWSAFYQELQEVLKTGKINSKKLKQKRRENFSHNLRFFIFIVLGMTIGGYLSAIIVRIHPFFGYLIGPFTVIGALLGIQIHFKYEIRNSKKSTIQKLVHRELKKSNNNKDCR